MIREKTWFLRGHQRIITTTGMYRGVKLIATVDFRTGKQLWHEDELYTVETFLSFLKNVIAEYPKGKIYCKISSCEATYIVPHRHERSS